MRQFPIVDDGIILPLRSRLASWAADEDRRGDLLGRYNVRVSEVTKAIERLLDALSTEAKTRGGKEQAQANDLNADVIRNFQDMTYRLAEAYDFFWRLPNGLETKSANKSEVREYKDVIKNVKRTACLICNKIKHNDHLLGRVDNFYDAGIYVEGFALYSRGHNAALKINNGLHDAEKPGMSFNLETRSLAFDFLRADAAAGRLCSAIGAGETKSPDTALLNSLRLLNSRPEIGLQFENAGSTRAMWEEEGTWVSGTRARKLPPLGNKVQVIQQFVGDGHTKTFPIAG